MLSATTRTGDAPGRVAVSGLTIRFGATTAVEDVDLELRAGQVVGLMGANGAGKSTLMKAVAGVIPLHGHRGRITVGDRDVTLGSPRDAERHGIGLVPQELLAVPEQSVLDNLFLGRQETRAGLIRHAAAREAAATALAEVGSSVGVDDAMGGLSASDQQLVQVARCLLRRPRFLLFDEPTSSLTPPEVEKLLRTIRRLADEGRGIMIVTHRLPEIFAVADRLHVMRDGRTAATSTVAESTPESVVDAMLGRELGALESAPRPVRAVGPIVLDVDGLTAPATEGRAALRDVRFSVRRGEVVGLFGLLGAGRSEVLEALYGIDGRVSGSASLDGVRLRGTVRNRIAAGLALVPEDRKRTGLVLERSVAENVSMATLGRVSRRCRLDRSSEARLAEHYVSMLGVKTASTETPVGDLSGGNQQKVVIGKCLATEPRLLLMDEPTRGIDVGAKADIFRILRAIADDGMAILLATSEPAEAISFCDRVLVMYRGSIVGEFEGNHVNEEKLMGSATGAVEMIAQAG